MAIKLYNGKYPVIQQPRFGNQKAGRIYHGYDLAYGALPDTGPQYVTLNLLQYIDPFESTIGGSTASDLSGNGNDATVVNSLTTTGTKGSARSGWRLDDTGGSSGYLNLGFTNYNWDSGGNGGVTFETFFQIETGASPDASSIMSQYTSARQIMINLALTSPYKALIQMQGSSNYIQAFQTGASIWDGNVHHVAITYENGVEGNLYIDGVSEYDQTVDIGNYQTNQPLLAGGPRDTGQIRGFDDAYMGLTRVYDRALTADEIVQNYNANKADYGL